MKNTVSLCMIAKNEEKYLPACLESIKDIVDEIIIVDTGSTDKTVEIAKSFGANVHFFKWNNNFSEARNESLKYASKDWIFIMDADEKFCSEDKKNFIDFLNGSLDENTVYSFQSLSYCGNTIDENNISLNLNPRIFKNNYGFHYEGIIHNQLANHDHKISDMAYPIRIYHYGYLENTMKYKNKRKRNIPLLESQLKENPENKYAHFNLGNEYCALDDYKKALEHYYKSYENFNPNSGYGFVLLARIVLTNYVLGNYDKAIEFADKGIGYFPKYTDLYFLKGLSYKQSKRPTLAIKSFEKCVKLGEPPLDLRFIEGTGGYKAYYELANTYFSIRDYNASYNCYIKSIQAKHDFVQPVYNIAHLLKEEKKSPSEFKSTIESFFVDYPQAYQILADISYLEGYYDLSLEYIKKSKENNIFTEPLMIIKDKSLIRSGNFDECINADFIKKDSSFYFTSIMYKVMSGLLTDKDAYSLSILNKFENTSLPDNDKKMFKVYVELTNLFLGKTAKILSDDKNEISYTPAILDICEILLANKKFDELEKALGLFNLISDKFVLLELGKLYYKYGYKDMSKKTIIQSIKQFEVFDMESLDILRCT